MGRPRGGKAKRPALSQAATTEDADAGSGDDEAVVPAYKRRGRPQRHFKADDDTDEEEEDGNKVKVAEATEDSDGTRPGVPSNNGVAAASVEGGGKKRRRRQWKRVPGGPAMEEEEEVDEPVRQAGFRPHGSRRKSTPRRAAEAGVECN